MQRLLLKLVCGLAATVLLFSQTATVVTRQGYPQAYGGPYDVVYVAVPTTLTMVDTGAYGMHINGYCFYNSTGSGITLTVETNDATPLPLPYNGSLAATSAGCFESKIGMAVKGMKLQASATGAYYSATWTH